MGELMFNKAGKAVMIMGVLLLVANSGSIYGEPVKSSTFEYYRDLVPEKKGKKGEEQRYGVFEKDSVFQKYGCTYDIRVTYNSQVLPYFIRPVEGDPDSRSTEADLKFSEEKGGDSVYVVKLREIPEEYCYTRIQLLGPESFEAEAELYISDNAKSWRSHGSRSVYRYDREDQNLEVKLGCIEEQYLKFVFDSEDQFRFGKVWFGKKSTLSDFIVAQGLERIESRTDRTGDGLNSYYYFMNSDHQSIHRMTFTFKEETFRREYEVYYKDPESRKYTYLTAGVFEKSRNDAPEQMVDLSTIVSGEIRLMLSHEDDRPLELVDFAAYSPREEVVFQLPEKEELEKEADVKYRIYYGNRFEQKPEFDIGETFDSTVELVRFTPGAHTENGEFSWSLIEPPVSIWIIRVLYFAGLSLVFLLSLSAFRSIFVRKET